MFFLQSYKIFLDESEAFAKEEEYKDSTPEKTFVFSSQEMFEQIDQANER